MHPPHSLTFGLLLAGIAAGLSSCSTAKKREIESEGGLLGRLSIDGVGQQEERETYAELKAIANDPSSKLPSHRSELEEADDELIDRKSTRQNSGHPIRARNPCSACELKSKTLSSAVARFS